MRSNGVTTKKEFRHVYRSISGSSKNPTDIKTAYQILSCCGKTVIQSHLRAEWPLNCETISLDALFDIYSRLGDLCIEEEELRQMKNRNIKFDQVVDSIEPEGLISKQLVEDCLRNYTNEDGTIDIEKLVKASEETRDKLLVNLMSHTDSPTISEHFEEVTVSKPTEEVIEKSDTFGQLKAQVRGTLAISPRLQAIFFRIDVDEPTECELVLSLSKNSDLPPGHFANDLFLFVARDGENPKMVGVTKFVLKNERYSTGTIEVARNDQIIILGMGTSFIRRKSTRERITLIEPDGKLSKRFKVTLMNIFDAFDSDQDGVLKRNELNFYTIASGDTALTDDEWALYHDNFDFRDGGMTMEGFIKMHQIEASDTGDHVLADLWHSLNILGYDTELQSIYGCSYDIFAHAEKDVRLEPYFQYVTVVERNLVLEKLYDAGIEQDLCVLKPHLFQTDYFGLLIARWSDEHRDRRFRLKIDDTENVRWNFPNGKEGSIKFDESDGEWILVCSYTTTNKNANVKVELIDSE
ncbi:unnamed protein product [Caenorhabditis bovis]|uniref:EF-hand domain-containing protein n=1 Tax=Caenorhabditis bovis TaxID=2654633 RepID=A0A8S1EY96_9PELO|nr:unnamed protein product [Caenorhabditis bovis]